MSTLYAERYTIRETKQLSYDQYGRPYWLVCREQVVERIPYADHTYLTAPPPQVPRLTLIVRVGRTIGNIVGGILDEAAA